MCVCSSPNASFYCAFKAICAVFFHTITLLQEGTEQLPWRSNRPSNSAPLPMEKREFLKRCFQADGIIGLAPSPGQARVQPDAAAAAGRQGMAEQERALKPGTWQGERCTPVPEAYRMLLNLRQPREGLTKPLWDTPCIPDKEWESFST